MAEVSGVITGSVGGSMSASAQLLYYFDLVAIGVTPPPAGTVTINIEVSGGGSAPGGQYYSQARTDWGINETWTNELITFSYSPGGPAPFTDVHTIHFIDDAITSPLDWDALIWLTATCDAGNGPTCDAFVDPTISFADPNMANFYAFNFSPNIPVPPTFDDVPMDDWAYLFIEKLASSGITAGCGNDNYCPSAPVTRAQMAVFLERGINGSDYSPPAATGTVFLDVGAGDFAAAWIEQLFADGITGGCGGNNYCPNDAVTRAQMAVFLLRAKYGSGYSPPAATGVFNDVDLGYWAAAWIEQLAAEGITVGCGGGNYCPEAEVTRDQMAVFLVRTFGL